MTPQRLLTGLCLLATCAACTSAPKQVKDPSFKTLITPERVKRFELSVIPKDLSITRPNPELDGGTRQARQLELFLQNALEEAITRSGFCRAGYLPLGRFAGESQYRLRGECKDPASDADLAAFPNSIERW